MFHTTCRQSPRAGLLAAPSPLVSPSAVSSRKLVKIIGAAEVPTMVKGAWRLIRELGTMNCQSLTTTPGASVNGARIAISPDRTTYGIVAKFQVPAWVQLPA